MKTKHRGKMKEQQKRRKERLKDRPQYQPELYELIDGNLTHYPRAFCEWHGGWLSDGLIDTHRCEQRQCNRLRKDVLEDGQSASEEGLPS